MLSNRQKLRLIGAFAALAILVLAASCTGFFVNPTVSSITIDPSAPTVGVGQTQQMSAAGTDSNGNSLTLTAGTSCTGTTVCWSSGTPTVATISTGGLLTGVSVGTATITASSGTATATATATVALSNITSILVSPTSISVPVSSTASGSNCLTAKAQPGDVDVTTTVTWNTPGTLVTVENAVEPMCVQAGDTAGPTTVNATYTLGDGTVITSNTVDVTVSQ
jgi:trimeric autotransporter adhesin